MSDDTDTIARAFGHDRLDVDAINVTPAVFDFSEAEYDYDQDDKPGTWRVAHVPSLEERLDLIDPVEISGYGITIWFGTPDRDGDVDVQITVDQDWKATENTSTWRDAALKLASDHGLDMDCWELEEPTDEVDIAAEDPDERTIEIFARLGSTEPFNADSIIEQIFDLDLDLFDGREDPDEWSPVMNYVYPLPLRDVPDDWTNLVINTTIVLIAGEPHLALTGGGMDFSWEIVESYLRLGFFPPAHFCDLPPMAGRGTSENDRAIIRACRESLAIRARWAKHAIERLDDMLTAADAA